MSLKTIFAFACLTAVFGITSVTYGAGTAHNSRAHGHKVTPHCKRATHRKGKHHKGCPRITRKRPTARRKAPTTRTTTPNPTTTASPPTPEPAPTCPQNHPLPALVAGQTTIVGYAWTSGGPAPGASPCPRLSSAVTVTLKTASGQTLESQTLGTGQPFDFAVQQGEYEIVDTMCMAEQLVRAPEGQQTQVEVGCNIP